MDAHGHVNNAVYLNLLEEARDGWVQEVLGPVADDVWHFVLARVAIDFRGELKQGDGEVLVRCRLESVWRLSIRARGGGGEVGGGRRSSVSCPAIDVPDPQPRIRRPFTKWSSYQLPATYVSVTPALLLPESMTHPLPT